MQRNISPWIFEQLTQARVFWFDWVFGLLVATHLAGARRVAEYLPLECAARLIRWCAGVSFAAYLFHAPLLHVLAAFLPQQKGWVAVGLTLAVIGVLGPTVERSKHWWRRELNQIVDLVAGPAVVAPVA